MPMNRMFSLGGFGRSSTKPRTSGTVLRAEGVLSLGFRASSLEIVHLVARKNSLHLSGACGLVWGSRARPIQGISIETEKFKHKMHSHLQKKGNTHHHTRVRTPMWNPCTASVSHVF